MYASDAKHSNQSLGQKLLSIYGLRASTLSSIDLGIRKPYRLLLERLGNPHQKLPPVIHVAGTNGKGSTIAFVQSILNGAGYSTHIYTSPHLISFNERIRLQGQSISDEKLEAYLDEALEMAQDLDITFFELTTAMAFKVFADHPADFILLETGLGGRLDCTNVIQKPVATVITRIGYDHIEFLGNQIDDIAFEKAGIMKKDVTCIIAKQEFDNLYAQFKQRAQEYGATLCCCGSEWDIKDGSFHSGNTQFSLNDLGLSGLYQRENAANAIACILSLKQSGIIDIDDTSIQSGLKKAHWSARLEKLDHGHLAGLLPQGWELWLDGGHNEMAGQALAAQINHWQSTDHKKLHVICAMMNHKDAKSFFKPVIQDASSVQIIPINQEDAAYKPEQLADILKPLYDDVKTAQSLESAIEIAVHDHNDQAGGRILICGSLYLAGQVLKNDQA